MCRARRVRGGGGWWLGLPRLTLLRHIVLRFDALPDLQLPHLLSIMAYPLSIDPDFALGATSVNRFGCRGELPWKPPGLKFRKQQKGARLVRPGPFWFERLA